MTADRPETPSAAPAPAKAPPKRRDRHVKLLFLVLALGVVVWLVIRQYLGPMPPGFGRDLPKALQQAAAENRNVVVLVDSRPPSHDGERIVTFTMRKPKNREALAKANVIGVRTTPNNPALQDYKVTDVPTMLLLDGQRKQIARREGFVGETDFPRFLEGKPPE